MTEQELQQYLRINFPKEDDACDWKEMKNLKNSFAGQEGVDVVSYVSAIANMEGGHLVIGVQDKTLEIIGTDLSKLMFNGSQATPESAAFKLTEQCTNLSSEGLTIEEYVTEDTHKTVWIIHIPKHLPRRPVYAHKKAWQRVKDSLVQMRPERMEAILDEPIFTAEDWSAIVVPNATIDDLEELAIAKARKMYKKVHSRIPAQEVDAWSVEELLSNSGLMIEGKLTRAAIILLGKPVSVYKLRPAVVEVTWSLRDEREEIIDYEHFTAPFILTVDEILAKIRNLTMRELPGGTLFPDTMKQYDDYTIREALHNCIAHQDYTLQQRINLVENPGFVYYENGGSFIPVTLQRALATKGPQRHFRNESLCKAMTHFNMIDTVSRGIKKMFNEQLVRRFPMPDFEIDAVNKVVGVRIYGKVIDEKYTQLLKTNTSLSLQECLCLDEIQKTGTTSKDGLALLKEKNLIEVQNGHYTISLKVAKLTHQVAKYTKAKGLAYEALLKLTLQLAHNAGTDGFKRKDAFEILQHSLPAGTNESKLRYVGRMLVNMAEAGQLKSSESGKSWIITEKGENDLIS